MKDFEELFTVDDIAKMTMLTTRTIRNYLKDGLLTGNKVGGQWRFTKKDVEKLFENSKVEDDMKNERRQEVMDFMDSVETDLQGEIQICTVADYYCSDVHMAKSLCDRFCSMVTEWKAGEKLRFHYEYMEKEKKARYTFFGKPDFISEAVKVLEKENRG